MLRESRERKKDKLTRRWEMEKGGEEDGRGRDKEHKRLKEK